MVNFMDNKREGKYLDEIIEEIREREEGKDYE